MVLPVVSATIRLCTRVLSKIPLKCLPVLGEALVSGVTHRQQARHKEVGHDSNRGRIGNSLRTHSRQP